MVELPYMIRLARQSGHFNHDDITASLAIEWIKNHSRRKDIIPTISNMWDSMVGNCTFDMKNEAVSNLVRNINNCYSVLRPNQPHHLHNTFDFHLKDFVSPRQKYKTSFPYTLVLHPETYYIFQFKSSTYAAYVDHQGKLTFYDPYIGEAAGLRWYNFIRTYLLDYSCEASIRRYNLQTLRRQYKAVCEDMMPHQLTVLSYKARPQNMAQVSGKKHYRDWK